MKRWYVLVATTAALSFAQGAANAQTIDVGVPGAGARVGESTYREHHEFDRQVLEEHRVLRERDVSLRSKCRTVTIRRDDGSIKRVEKCD